MQSLVSCLSLAGRLPASHPGRFQSQPFAQLQRRLMQAHATYYGPQFQGMAAQSAAEAMAPSQSQVDRKKRLRGLGEPCTRAATSGNGGLGTAST